MKATVLQTEMLFIFIGGGGGVGGRGILRAAGIFFSLSNSLYEFILGHSMNIF